jgi:hypothetical protein
MERQTLVIINARTHTHTHTHMVPVRMGKHLGKQSLVNCVVTLLIISYIKMEFIYIYI